MQRLVYNEWNKKEKFYHMLAAEAKLRSWAQIYPHAYFIAIFASNRQIYNHEKMNNHYSLEEAKSLGYTDTGGK